MGSRKARKGRQEMKSMELCVFLFPTIPSQIFRPKRPTSTTQAQNETFLIPHSSFLIPNSLALARISPLLY